VIKRTIIAALASLMLAGAICAVSGATINRETGMVVLAGDGTAPMPVPPTDGPSVDTLSVNK
jgi:hypothetical protein